MLQTLHEITNERHNVIITRSQEEPAECVKESDLTSQMQATANSRAADLQRYA